MVWGLGYEKTIFLCPKREGFIKPLNVGGIESGSIPNPSAIPLQLPRILLVKKRCFKKLSLNATLYWYILKKKTIAYQLRFKQIKFIPNILSHRTLLCVNLRYVMPPSYIKHRKWSLKMYASLLRSKVVVEHFTC